MGFLCLKDYEEDFEEMDESENEGEDEEQKEEPKVTNEIEEIQRAMEEENERARTAQSRQIMSREEDDGPKSPSGTFISFIYPKYLKHLM